MSSFNNKNYETCTETRKYGLYMEKKQLIETISEEFQILDLLDKGFKSAIFKYAQKSF